MLAWVFFILKRKIRQNKREKDPQKKEGARSTKEEERIENNWTVSNQIGNNSKKDETLEEKKIIINNKSFNLIGKETAFEFKVGDYIKIKKESYVPSFNYLKPFILKIESIEKDYLIIENLKEMKENTESYFKNCQKLLFFKHVNLVENITEEEVKLYNLALLDKTKLENEKASEK